MGINNNKKYKKRTAGSRKRVSIIIMLIVLFITLMGALSGFITDWLWFKELGYGRVFWTKILTQFRIGVPVFILAGLMVRLYLKSLKSGYFRKIESHEIPDAHRLNVISWLLSAIFGFVAALFASGGTWLNFLKFTKNTSFGLKDPLFGLDVGFYVFKLEFLTQVNSMALVLVIGITVITLVYYSILLAVRTPDIFDNDDEMPGAGASSDVSDKTDEDDVIGSYIKKRGRLFSRLRTGRNPHNGADNLNSGNLSNLMEIASGKLMVLGVIFYIMVGLDFMLKQFDLLHAHTGTVYGAGFTDVNITLLIYRAIIALSLIGAVTFCVHMRKSGFRKLLRIPAIIIAVFVAGKIAGIGVQQLVVSPDEINKETKYIESNIKFTRHAYGLDDIEVKEFPAANSIDSASIRNNLQTVSNIRINDYEPVKDFYNQTQSIRQYYDFNDVDIDRYKINGAETQTYLSPREINEKKISSTWINKHLKYTHGYGVTLSQVDAVTANGQPDVRIKDIPPISDIPEIKITRPEIYFGELTNDYIIVNTNEQEFDYPDGNENKYTKYEGNAGIKLNPLTRLLFAMREGSMKFLVSTNVKSDSRIIINRNVIDRIKKVMPYLSYEEDPYMTAVNGRLYWITDAYTTSAYYPYSEPYSGEVNSTNYIRNSVKVVVDAYNGDVSFYVVDGKDPIINTYKKIYPTLFKDEKDMPRGIREHIRYPNALFRVQAGVYTKYHMNTVKVFYQNEDLWDISRQIYGTEEKQMDPSYYIFRLPTEEKAEFINMIPFTPKSKQNMTAVMMARNDGGNYGKMLVYKFPKNKTVYGPMQIEAQIDQNTEISKEFSLWNSSGSRYRRGDMFVVPIEDSLMYVEPVYLEASNQAIPEVKRVIVAYDNKIAYKSTLSEALEELFGAGYESGAGGKGAKATESGEASSSASSSQNGASASSVRDLAKKAAEAYDKAVEAQRRGDWKSYGEYLDELADYLNKLKQAK